jgi:TRAP transporter TAXI family solute receptor
MHLSGFMYRYGRWISWIVMIISVLGVIYWGYGLTAPSELRIATGKEGGDAHNFGQTLKRQLEKYTDFTVVLRPSGGSVDNQALLLSGEVDIAIVNAGFVYFDNLTAINPLWHEYVHLIKRNDANINDIPNLRRKSVALGDEGSKNREIGLKLLNHYALNLSELNETNAEFSRLSRDSSYLATLLISGSGNPDLAQFLRGAQFTWLPINEAEGIAESFPFFFKTEIPAGLFPSVSGPLPRKPVPTLGTTTILASRADASYQLVQEVLQVMNQSSMFQEYPGLLGRSYTQTEQWLRLPIHSAANRFFTTYSGLQMLSEFAEKLNRIKVILLFSVLLIIAGVYELKRRQQAKQIRQIREETKRLESWLAEIIHLEQEQKKAKDLRLLKQYLKDALIIKENAFKDLVGSELQNSVFFQTFLLECVHVIQELELKIAGQQK